MNTRIISAIKARNIVEFYYEGELRIVEPYCYGKTLAGHEGLRAYQIGGYSSQAGFSWRMYNLKKANNISITEQTFHVLRSGYRRGDKGMSEIYVEV